jgi:hypothetical protein
VPHEGAALSGRKLPSASLASPLRSAEFARADWLVPAFVFGVCALVLRGIYFGNPAIHVDEQFYLLVGDRMLHGALPYVDIWDRKPVGLFLIYALARLLWGDGVLAYQIMAWAGVTTTTVIIYRLARMIAAPPGAWLAGIAYLLYLTIFNCAGGQTPVFYNLPVAFGMVLLTRITSAREHPGLARRGAMLMLVVGLAMQIKYTVVFEGLAFGLALLARAWADGAAFGRMRALAGLWIGCALAPTALAWASYAWLGHGAAFAQANFTSVFQRAPFQNDSPWWLIKEMVVLTPFWLAIFRAPRHLAPVTGDNPDAKPLLRFWAAAAVGGFLVFGTWYDHYVGPLLPPLAVLAAPALGRPKNGRGYTILMLAVGLVGAVGVIASNLHERGNAADIERASALIRSHLDGGCLYVFEAEPVLYRTTNSCLLSRFVFPAHLSNKVEANALGVRQEDELDSIMRKAPAVVLIAERPIDNAPNLETRRILLRHLEDDYLRFAKAYIGTSVFDLYQRRDLALRQELSAAGSASPPNPGMREAAAVARRVARDNNRI